MKKAVIFLLLLLPLTACAQLKPQSFTIDSFTAKKEGRDTLKYINIFRKYDWEIVVIYDNGARRRFLTSRPDTINAKDIASINLTAAFAVDPWLVNHDCSLNYDFTGSLLMKLNGVPVLSTGTFAKDEHSEPGRIEQYEFINFMFKDTLEKIEITYIPHPRIRTFDLKLVIFQLNKGFSDYYKADVTNVRIQSFSFGFYYLSFGTVFLMLFFFFKQNNENLYFSLFSFFLSFSFFSSAFSGLYANAISLWSAVFATEFICLFLAKVFRNKQRSMIPLTVVSIVALVALYPSVLYHYSFFFDKVPESVGSFIGVKLLFFYEIYLTIYILVWGLRRKNKDAKTIFVFALVTSLLYVIFPLASNFMPELRDLSFVSFVYYIPNFGLCIFPIGSAIVLGNRNGENQKQLLEKEKEKKRILENQKESLEQEVALRTAEVVRQKEEIEKQHDELKIEKKKSDDLLLNILPEEVAEELKETGHSEARFFNDVSVLFTDFVDFTKAGERMTPQELVDELHICFKTFDEIVSRYDIEKIKTIGDAYLAVCGLPMPVAEHGANVVNAALEIRQFMADRKERLKDKVFDIRIGIHSGSVVAGIVGVKKFAYDIWGDTVNTAARMEQSSASGKINISQTTYDLIKDRFACTYRGEVRAKNKGELSMYFVDGQMEKII